MTESQVALVQATFAEMAQRGDGAASFYEALFEIEPRLRYLFADDMAEQRRHFLFSIGTIVRRLDSFDSVRAHIRNLGIRHASYGVQPADYARFKAAMLRLLEQNFGSGEDEILAAWTALFDLVSQTMLEASLAVRGEKDRPA